MRYHQRRHVTDSHLQAAVQSRVGAVLGNYRITEAISAGGMGAVYRAVHELLGRAVAIKILRPDLTDSHELVQRFFNEAKAASAIHHPGIVEVFDFGYTPDHGEPYLVMELLDGEPLSRRLQGARLNEVVAAHVARGIASALVAAHGKGIVHRDLKPDNVFLVPDPDVPMGERAKLLDFGIAKLTELDGRRHTRHTQTGALIGTPMNMAPEQAAAAGEVDHRADLYSLGCLLYEMLCGEPPFVAEGAGEIIALQMFASPDRPSTRLAAISSELEAITLRLLEKEPARRFQSAAEVVDALGNIAGRLSGRLATQLPTTGSSDVNLFMTPRPESPDARPPAIPIADKQDPTKLDRPTSVTRRRGPSSAAIIGGSLVVAIAVVGVALMVTRTDEPPAAPAPPPPVVHVDVPAPPPPVTPPPAPPPEPPKPPPHKIIVAKKPLQPPTPPTPPPPPPTATKVDECRTAKGSLCDSDIGVLPSKPHP